MQRMADWPDSTGRDGRARRRAWIQLLLGQLQIVGATAGLYLLVTSGLTAMTVAVVAVTFAVTMLSRVLHHRT
jgi:hypothetical protein